MMPVLFSANEMAAKTGDVVFSETFDTQDDFARWTIVDKNGGRTWEFLNGAAAYMLDYQTGLPGDDWLISPEFELDAAKVYTLEYTLGFNSRIENLRVLLGSSTDTETFTTVLADYPNAHKADGGEKTVKVVIKSSGKFRIAFYSYSAANMHRIDVDNVKLVEASAADAPGNATDVSLTPGDKGSMAATLKFAAPSVTASGENLAASMSINVYRNGGEQPVKTFEEVSPGSPLTWTDLSPLHGDNTYAIVASNTHGNGEAVKASAFVGLDVPEPVSNLKARLNSERGINLAWNAPTASVNGGYVDFASLKYVIYRGDELIADDVSEPAFTDNVPVESGQVSVVYKVMPVSEGGTGEPVQSVGVTTGIPFAIPYKESFAGQAMHTPWSQDADVSEFGWELMPDDEDGEYEEVVSQDSDGGMLMADSKTADYGSQSRYISPLLDLSKATNPVLTFWFYYSRSPWYDPDMDGQINDNIRVQMSSDAGEWKDIENSTFYVNDENHSGWTKCTVSLPRQNGKFVRLALVATAESEGSAYRNLYVDNISVDESEYKNDLVLDAFEVDKKRIDIGQTATFKVTVFNRGEAAVSDYSVCIYRDDELAATLSGVSVSPAEKQTLEYSTTGTLDDAETDSHSWRAEIVFGDDELANNNTSTTLSTSVRKPDLPTVTGLSGATSAQGVALAWDKASSVSPVAHGEPQAVTDDFESYDPFAIEGFGDWTVYDGDKATTLVSPRIPLSYEHQGEPMAFQVFNNIEAGTWVEDNMDQPFEAHSGNQYMMCPSADYPAENDDWLISPRLDGRAQTISFYAHAATYDAEWMQVLCSSTDTHHDSFVKISEGDHISVYEPWKQYSFDVPEGTRYVAVRCVRRCVFLFVDDFSYNRYDGATDGLTFIGYNVYRDGKKINSKLLTDNSFVDATASSGEPHAYKVTAVYDKGESAYSEAVEVTATGIEGTESDVDREVSRYDVSGRKLGKPSRGVNIIRMSDGTVKKVVAK